MDLFAFAPVAAVLQAAYSALEALSLAVHPLLGSASAAATVVIVTVVVRALLIPVGMSQARATAVRVRLAPRLAALRRKYGKDAATLQRKTAELYASENASPFAGMLPALAQVPVISTVYALFVRASINGHANALLAQQLLGVPLSSSLLHLGVGGAGITGVVLFVAIVGATVVIAWFSRRAAVASAVELPGATDSSRRTVAVMSWAPFASVGIAVFVPLAAGLYLLVSGAWMLAERELLRRRQLRLAPN
jgi:YidC/Oxa1 family membrane protein insertase